MSLCIFIFAYTAFKKSLEDAIASETSGHFKRVLISLSQVPSTIITLQDKNLIYCILRNAIGAYQGGREEGPADMASVIEDAQVSVTQCCV